MADVASLPSPAPHLLYTVWILWREGGNQRPLAVTTADEWCTRLTLVVQLASVEEFWHLFNNFESLSDIPIGASLNFFKRDVKPLWEDPANDGGGRWYFNLEKSRYNTTGGGLNEYNSKIQETWLYILLSLIGNTIDIHNLICGAVVSIRARETRFMIWTRKSDVSKILELGKSLKQNLKYCSRLSYRKHSDRRRTSKALYC